jgi:hypothetical protein
MDADLLSFFRSREKQPFGSSVEDIHILAKWRQVVAMIVVVLLAVLSWARLVVVDPRLMMVGMVVAIVLAVAIQGRIKLLESQEEVESACCHAYWEKASATAVTYDEWAYAASRLKRGDEAAGYSDGGAFYDESFVRGKLSELQLSRTDGDINCMLFSLQSILSRDLGNMCNPELHRGRQKIPPLVCNYLNEVRCTSFCNHHMLFQNLNFFAVGICLGNKVFCELNFHLKERRRLALEMILIQ